MTIYIYTGTVGSGKSYHALQKGLLRSGTWKGEKYTIANFPVKNVNDRQKTNWIYEEELTVEKLFNYTFQLKLYGKEGQGLLIIDEAGVMFNSRDWNVGVQERKEWIHFFTQSRKLGFDVIFVVQDMRMLDRQIRSCAEYEIKHIKGNQYGYFAWVPFTFFFQISHWQGAKFRGTTKIQVFRKKIARKYDTMKMFKVNDDLIALAKKYGYDIGGS